MQKVLLDTNAYSLLLKGDSAVAAVVEQAKSVYFSSISIGELLHGFRLGSRENKNRAMLEDFLNQSFVRTLSVTVETAQAYAEMVTTLKQNGTPIPMNDVWIAAHAMESGSTMVTLDRHFLKVPGLRVWPHLRAAN